MKTLTAGSFLNFENAENVEALKHTARRLAEHTATVVKENLQPTALENLASALWTKAEYVTRETERRRLQQIFAENFGERFRELKPEVAKAQDSDFEVLPAAAPVENVGSSEASNATAIVESVESESAATGESASSSVSLEEPATVAEGKRDEFPGFVEPGASFGEPRTAETSATAQATEAATTLEEVAPTAVQNADELIAEAFKPENQLSASDNEKESTATVNSDRAKTETTTVAAATTAESKPVATATAAGAGKSETKATDGREPFEFERCTINLNLTLLPAEPGKTARKVIVGAVSHNLPPEIDFLEINDGDNLTEIAAFVRDKLARFKQTLPVKYIEQLRASKTKSAKKTAPAKATTAAAAVPTQSAVTQANAEKPSGEQKASEAKTVETAKPQSEAAAENTNVTASVAPNRAVNQSVAANSIQGSLF